MSTGILSTNRARGGLALNSLFAVWKLWAANFRGRSEVEEAEHLSVVESGPFVEKKSADRSDYTIPSFRSLNRRVLTENTDESNLGSIEGGKVVWKERSEGSFLLFPPEQSLCEPLHLKKKRAALRGNFGPQSGLQVRWAMAVAVVGRPGT